MNIVILVIWRVQCLLDNANRQDDYVRICSYLNSIWLAPQRAAKKTTYRRGRSIMPPSVCLTAPMDLVVRLTFTTSTLLRSLAARVILLTASFESSTLLSNKRFSS